MSVRQKFAIQTSTNSTECLIYPEWLRLLWHEESSHPLIADPRMGRVWQEVFRKKRINYRAGDEFFNSVKADRSQLLAQLEQAYALSIDDCFDFGWKDEEGQLRALWTQIAKGSVTDQELGAICFLDSAYNLAYGWVGRPYIVTSKEFAPNLKSAKRLRREAKLLRARGVRDPAMQLETIAVGLERTTRGLDECVGVVDRNRSDPEVRAYVIALAESAKKIFGQAMLGTAATITNVVFVRQNLSANRVNAILRNR